MIDQKLGINILNNLLCIQASAEQQGDESQRDAALNSEFCMPTETSVVAQLSFETATEISGELDGGSLKDAEGSTYSKPYTETFSTREEAEARMNEILSLYKRPTFTFKRTEKKLQVPISSVIPQVSSLNKEKQKVYAIGMLEPQLNQVIEELSSFQLIYCDYNFVTASNSQNRSKFEKSITNINKEIEKIAASFKKQVLNDLPYYANSSYTGGYSYKIQADGSESSQKIQVVGRIPVTIYTYHEEIHYFQLKYTRNGSTYSISDSTTHRYYQKENTTTLDCTLDAWYYSQIFSTAAYYPEKAYIGLFTDYNHSNDLSKNSNGMPNADGTGFREPPFKQTNPSDEQKDYTYQRMDLHRGLFTDGYVFDNIKQATEEDVVGKDEPNELLGKAYLKNSEIIMFPEILTQGEGETKGWGKIYGFGIFSNEKPVEGETPFFWGPVMDAPVETNKDEVPLFRPSQFEVYLG